MTSLGLLDNANLAATLLCSREKSICPVGLVVVRCWLVLFLVRWGYFIKYTENIYNLLIMLELVRK